MDYFLKDTAEHYKLNTRTADGVGGFKRTYNKQTPDIKCRLSGVSYKDQMLDNKLVNEITNTVYTKAEIAVDDLLKIGSADYHVLAVIRSTHPDDTLQFDKCMVKKVLT